MASTPLFIAEYRNQNICFVPGFSTRPRVIYTPGENGSILHAIGISSSDDAAKKLTLSIARPVTLVANMGTGHITDGGGGADTITRTSGSFVTDEWRAGDRLFVKGATTLANDFAAYLTAVAAATLSVATSTVAADEDMPAGSMLMRQTRIGYVDIAAGSGLLTVPAVSGLNTTQMPMLDASPDRLITLGPNDYLVGELDGAVGTGETVEVTTFGADY